MKSRRYLTTALAAACLLLAACSDKKDATSSNFEAAIKAALANGPTMCVAVTALWPDEVRDNDDEVRELRPFVNAGLLSADSIGLHDMFGRNVAGHRYNLTAEGRKFADRGNLCYGKARLVKLLSWDSVTTVAGMSSTRAYFTYEIDGLPDWAKRADVQEAFPNLRTLVQGQDRLKMQMNLIMAGDHWEKE